MALRTAAKNIMLDALSRGVAPTKSITQVSLHSGFPATDENELNGGSPAYARKAIAFDVANATADDTAPARSFDVPPGASVAAIAFRAADGTILGDQDVRVLVNGVPTPETFVGQGSYLLTDTKLTLADA